MMRLLILGAFVAVAAAGNLGYAPSLEYAAPKIEYRVAPLPAPVYHTRAIEVSPSYATSSFKQEIIHPGKTIEYVTAYAPAPVLRAEPLPAVIATPVTKVISGYSYRTAPEPIPLLKSYVAPAPVLRAEPLPVIHAPAPLPVTQVVSGYSYRTAPQPIPLLKSYEVAAPVHYEIAAKPLLKSYAYSAPAPLLREYPIAPHSRYGVPHY